MTLRYTADEARDRFRAYIGRTGLPQPWWGLDGGNDCVGYALERLGVRGPRDYAPKHISIREFRKAYRWEEVDRDELRAGDLVAENWTGTTDGGRLVPEHLEYVYSVDHARDRFRIISANTGPAPGVPSPRGVWTKDRPLDGHILFGIRPPYKQPVATRTRKALVRRVAAYLNDVVKADVPRSKAYVDGVEGPNYWRLVQTWGRWKGLYDTGYRIDGIPGPRTRIVEAAADKAARAKG